MRTERGAELHRRTAADVDELLYWLLVDAIGALVHRARPPLLARWRRRDPRRDRFALHLDLLARLDPAWARRKREYFDGVLARHPFRDGAPATVRP